MSRIGNKIINIPQNVTITFSDGLFLAKAENKEMSLQLGNQFDLLIEDNSVYVKRLSESKDIKAKHGLYRSLIFNIIKGISEGYVKELELFGVGFRASNQGQKLDLSLGYSHNILFEVCSEVKIETKTEKGSNPKIILKSHDKQLLGQVCAKIRSLRKHDPYKGKGIRFVGEIVRRKAGKTTA